MNVLLVSTYELGHQPFGLASPAAWLVEAGAQVSCNDLAVEPLNEHAVRDADLIGLHLQMHTATRLACQLLKSIRTLNPKAHLCFYGLYAPLNEDHLRRLGANTILGGEFETGLVGLYLSLAAKGGVARSQSHLQAVPVVSLAKQAFRLPERQGLPPLAKYAWVIMPDGSRRTAGYTEASRGCKHLCRHCPVVPVYGGRFRIVQRDIVMADVRQQVAAGARHVTFGDPDFFNGIGHAMRLVYDLHVEFPDLSYDVTVKIEHLLKHARYLEDLQATGCLFVTTAVESIDDDMLAQLDKGHTRDDFVRVVALARDAGLALSPTFIPFSPWTSVEGYLELLQLIVKLDLVANVSPIQLAIRLLVTNGSRLLELPHVRRHLKAFHPASLCYPWAHRDARVERLFAAVNDIVQRAEEAGEPRCATFERIWHLAHKTCERGTPPLRPQDGMTRAAVAHMSEPWYCCAEPTPGQTSGL